MRPGKAAPLSTTISQAAIVLLAVVPLFVGVFAETPVHWTTRSLTATLWVLSLNPFYRYFSHRHAATRRPIPFLPAISLMYGLYYALPLTLGITNQYDQAPIDPAVDYEFPVELAFLGWVAMMGGYAATGFLAAEKPPRLRVGWSRDSQLTWGLMLLFGSLAVAFARLRYGSGAPFKGLLQFVESLQWLGAGLLVILARRGQIGPAIRLVTLAGIGLAAVFAIAGGSVAPLMMLAAAVALAFWIGKPQIGVPWLVVGLVVLLFGMSLRGVTIEFRRSAWFGRVQMTTQERAVLMLKLLENRAKKDGAVATVIAGVTATAGRSANLDLFANVVRRTPHEVPYWDGQTYRSLVGAFIPRFLWPDKPTKDLGQTFAHRYNLIHWSNRSTSINLPILVEFYINFAAAGVLFGMLVVGCIYRALDSTINRPGQSHYVSMFGAVLLLPLLVIESDFSLVFGGLPLTAAALGSLWWIMSRGSSKPTATARPGLLYAPRPRLPQARPPAVIESSTPRRLR